MKQIGPSVTKNYLRMRFTLQLGMEFLHPCRINLTNKFSNIVPCLINNVVTLCPLWRLEIIGKDLRFKSRNSRSLRNHRTILTTMRPQGCHVRRSQVMVSYRYISSRARIPPKIVVSRVTVYCVRRQECLSACGYRIAPKFALEKVLTRHPPRIVW